MWERTMRETVMPSPASRFAVRVHGHGHAPTKLVGDPKGRLYP